MTPFLEAHDAHQAPHDGASDPTRRAFVAACVAWARMRRRDLPRDALQLAATLYGAEWFAADLGSQRGPWVDGRRRSGRFPVAGTCSIWLGSMLKRLGCIW